MPPTAVRTAAGTSHPPQPAIDDVTLRGVRGTRLLTGSLVLGGVLLAGSPAQAEPETDRANVATLPIQFDGKPGPTVRKRMQDNLGQGLSRGDFDVVDPDEVAAKVPEGTTCDDAACYRRVAETVGATHVVRTVVKIRSRDYEVKIDLIAADDGSVIASSSETCEICGLDEAANLISAKAAVVATQLASAVAGAPVLSVTSSPKGATVHIDGKPAGKTPFEGKLEPGKHLIRVSKRGHVTIEREITLAKGVRSRAEFPLERVSTAEPVIARSARPWGWAGLGVGIAMLGGGFALLALDDRENEGRCSGNEQDSDGDCKFLFNTQWGGASLAIAGAIAGTLGVAILVTTRNAPKDKPKVRAAIGPASVGLQGSF